MKAEIALPGLIHPVFARLRTLLADPPPAQVFEISGGGIASARLGEGISEIAFQPLAPGTLEVSPLKDNVRNEEAFTAAVNAAAGPGPGRKRRVALILPDYCTRIAVLDFDAFPGAVEEQEHLVRFRMKKSVPFDIEGAALSYYAQPKSGRKNKIEVVVAVTALEILARYEAPFRAAGLHPGIVTTSLLASLHMVDAGGVTVVAKICGRVLTVGVLDENALKLVRCVDLETVDTSEMESVLLPTLAYVEDELGRPATRVLLCGFGARASQWAAAWRETWGATVEPLRSRRGLPGEADAGVMGYMESLAA